MSQVTSPVEQMYQQTLIKTQNILSAPSLTTSQQYGRITDAFLFSRVNFLKQALLKQLGPVIQSGPFAKMAFHSDVSEGCFIPKLLGCYEAELHAILNNISKQPYKQVINIGCAEGYYSVGLARLLPTANILSYDINQKAQAMCKELADLNGVGDRVQVSGLLTKYTLLKLLKPHSLIVCDIEGNEYELLKYQPKSFEKVDLLIELHGLQDNAEKASSLLQSFEGSHKITIISPAGRNPNAYPALSKYKQLDQWLCIWEFRGENTPWAWLEYTN